MIEEKGYWTSYRDRLKRGRLGRRRLLQGMALSSAGLAAAAVLGCGEEKPTAPPSGVVSPQPKRGGILRRQAALAGPTQGIPIDPHVQSAIASRSFRLYYQGLLRYDLRTWELQPELAQKWEQPSPTEYVFTLQPGVKWHNKPPLNGREFTADDVVFSLRRAGTNDPRFFSSSLLVNLDKVEALDKATVRMTTKALEASFIAKMSADPFTMLAREVVERAGNFVSPEVVVGTGPFMMTALEERVVAEYVRNPDYWRSGFPYLDGLREHYFSSTEAAYAAFRAGQVDLLEQTPGQEVKGYIAQAQRLGMSPEFARDDSFPVMAQANTQVPPMNDPRVTKALRLLIDHEEIRKSWEDEWFGAALIGTMFPPSLDQWDLSEAEYRAALPWKQPKDEAAREAIALLQAAGFSQANPLRFELTVQVNVPANYQEATGVLLQSQWKRLSQGIVDAQLKIVDRAVSQQVRSNRTFVYLISGNGGAINEPGVWLNQLYRTRASRNYMGFSDPTIDALIDKQDQTFDTAQRKAVIREIITLLMDRSPGVQLVGRLQLNAVKPEVRGHAPEIALTGFQYEQVWLNV